VRGVLRVRAIVEIQKASADDQCHYVYVIAKEVQDEEEEEKGAE